MDATPAPDNRRSITHHPLDDDRSGTAQLEHPTTPGRRRQSDTLGGLVMDYWMVRSTRCITPERERSADEIG
jgi:hypothetical protein